MPENRKLRKAIRLEEDHHHVAAMYAAKHKDRSVTALVRRLIDEAVERDRIEGDYVGEYCPTCRKLLVDCRTCGSVGAGSEEELLERKRLGDRVRLEVAGGSAP